MSPCPRCNRPECPGPVLSDETKHRFPADPKEIERIWDDCAAHAVNWRGFALDETKRADDNFAAYERMLTRATAAERNHAAALSLISDFQSAIGINVGGDPGGVTPAHVEEFIAKLGCIHRVARELIRHMKARRTKTGVTVYENAPPSVLLGDLVDAVSAFAAKYPEE